MKILKFYEQFLNEQATDTEIKICKVSEEGIKNVSPQMISDPAENFPGEENDKQTITGNYKGVKYSWDMNGVEGIKSVRGVMEVYILTRYTEDVMALVKDKGIDLSDAKPKSPCVGFCNVGGTQYMMAYPTTSGKCKVIYFVGEKIKIKL